MIVGYSTPKFMVWNFAVSTLQWPSCSKYRAEYVSLVGG